MIEGEVTLHIAKREAFQFPTFLVKIVFQIFVFLNKLLGFFFRLRRVYKVLFCELNAQAFDISKNVSERHLLQMLNFIHFLVLKIVLVVFKRYLGIVG